MPVLPNVRHETYAQLLAQGMHQGRAYEAAGFADRHRSNASTLARKAHIKARVEELLSARAKVATQTLADTVVKFELSRQWVIDKLVKNAEIALGEKPINPRAEQLEYRWDGAVAARSLELLGREVGLFTEKKQIDIMADVKRLSDAELLAQIRETAGELLELSAETVEPEVIESVPEYSEGHEEDHHEPGDSP